MGKRSDDCWSPDQRHLKTSSAIYSRFPISSTSSAIGESETDAIDVSLLSKDSLAFAGLSWELNDLLNKDDRVGSDCGLDAGTAPAKAAGWNERFGMY